MKLGLQNPHRRVYIDVQHIYVLFIHVCDRTRPKRQD